MWGVVTNESLHPFFCRAKKEDAWSGLFGSGYGLPPRLRKEVNENGDSNAN
jgi:hypothetical protein